MTDATTTLPRSAELPLVVVGLVASAEAAHEAPLTLSVEAGELVVMLWPQGSGSRSFSRTILGLERPHRGAVRCLGLPVPVGQEAALVAMRRRIGWVPAQGALLSNLTLEANLQLPLRYHEAPAEEEVQRRAAEILALLKMAPLPPTIPPLVDRALCRQVALARALMLRPELLLLEELTDGMDPATARSVWATLAGVCQRLGVAAVALTGDATAAHGHAHRIIDRVLPAPAP